MQKLDKRIKGLELATGQKAVRYVVVPPGFIGPFPENVIAVCTGVPRSEGFGREMR